MIVSELWRYPVKSLGGEALDRAEVEPWGIGGDRRWMLIDPAGQALCGSRHPRLVTVTAAGSLRLRAAGHPDLEVAEPVGGRAVEVGLRGVGRALAAGAAADAWLRAVLDLDVRLVWLDDPARRPMSERHGGLPGDVLSLADAAPLLLTTAPSLRRLNSWIAGPEPLAMPRFRPNLVVDGQMPAFAEDGWHTLQIGEVGFRFAELCDRCAVTMVDPITGVRGKEPIRTLAAHRRWDRHVWFGIRIVPVGRGTIAVGDPVQILE
jgi:MOSC domain-containing protein